MTSFVLATNQAAARGLPGLAPFPVSVVTAISSRHVVSPDAEKPLAVWWAVCGTLAGVAGAALKRDGHFNQESGRRAARGGSRVARSVVAFPTRESEVATRIAIPGLEASAEIKQKKAEQYKLLLLNDPLNKREFVARCLMVVCLLDDAAAFNAMMKAHKDGSAFIGMYSFEVAETYCEGLRAKGLNAEMVPVDGGDQ